MLHFNERNPIDDRIRGELRRKHLSKQNNIREVCRILGEQNSKCCGARVNQESPNRAPSAS
jgi:hypothetical protein